MYRRIMANCVYVSTVFCALRICFSIVENQQTTILDINTGAGNIIKCLGKASKAKEVVRVSDKNIRTIHRRKMDYAKMKGIVVWKFRTVNWAEKFAELAQNTGQPRFCPQLLNFRE